jgi:hypothetical protein
MYSQAVDTSSRSFSGGFGAWRHVAGSEERKQGVGRPREDVARSLVWLDLRSEPWWFAVGEIPPGVRFTVRWVDLWGFVLDEESASEHAPLPKPVLASAPVSVHDVPAEIDHVVSGESSFVGLLTESRWRDPYALSLVTPNQADRTVRDRIDDIGVAAGHAWDASAFPADSSMQSKRVWTTL